MTSTAQGKWKLSIQSPATNADTSEPHVGYSFFGSREMALKFACERRASGHKTIRIEGPNDASMNEAEISEWCAALKPKE